MKFIKEYQHGKPVFVNVDWSDHWPSCEACRDSVDLDKPATFVHACVTGSQLIREEMVKRQAPEVKRKAAEVKEWARKAGVFKGCN